MHVAEGQFVSISSPSGAGKSTIFRLLTGGAAAHCKTVRSRGEQCSSPTDQRYASTRRVGLPWRRSSTTDTGVRVQGTATGRAVLLVAIWA
jgi:ABC-type nitrate/sulfonate/bicarbonate transport system ATPase subunit